MRITETRLAISHALSVLRWIRGPRSGLRGAGGRRSAAGPIREAHGPDSLSTRSSSAKYGPSSSFMQATLGLRGWTCNGTGTHVKPVQRSNWGLGGLSALAGLDSVEIRLADPMNASALPRPPGTLPGTSTYPARTPLPRPRDPGVEVPALKGQGPAALSNNRDTLRTAPAHPRRSLGS